VDGRRGQLAGSTRPRRICSQVAAWVAQVGQETIGLHMMPVAIMPGFKLARGHIEANAGVIEPALEFAGHLEVLQRAFTELAAALLSQPLQMSCGACENSGS